MMRIRMATAALFLMSGAMIAPALPAAAQEWTGQITPYLWAPGLGGDLTPFSGAPTLSFDSSISEVMKDSDGAFFLSAYARRDRFVIMGDFSQSSSSKSGMLPPGLPAEGKLKQRSITVLAGWRALANDRMTLDLLAGARAWDIKSSITVAGGLVQAAPGKDFVDPIVALRGNFALGPNWSLIVYGDMGGFGGGSENTSQIVATFNYQVNDNLHVSAGYRQLSVDYRSGGTRVDVTMAGPLLGATWRF